MMVGVVVTVAPAAGEVIATAGGKSVTLATPSPLMVTATLCTVTCPLPLRSRKSAAECCLPPKYASVAVTVAVFQVSVLVSGMLGGRGLVRVGGAVVVLDLERAGPWS